jgi:hypothetical protein
MWAAWAALWLAPLAITACAIVAEYGLEANNYDGWISPWIQVNIACELLTLALGLTALLGGRWARKRLARRSQQSHGGILAESAPGAAIEG